MDARKLIDYRRGMRQQTAILRAALKECLTDNGAYCLAHPSSVGLTRRLREINMIVTGAQAAIDAIASKEGESAIRLDLSERVD